MKIGFPAFVLDEGRSGVGKYIISLLETLEKEDKKNTYEVFLPSSDSTLLSFTNPRFQKIITPDFLRSPLPSILWHNAALALKKMDVVHIPTMRRIPLVKGCKVVTTVHDLAPFVVAGKYDPIRTFYHKEILSRLIFRSDRLIAVSHSTKNDLMKFMGVPEEKITVIYSGIDKTVYCPRQNIPPAEKPFLVYVSRIEHPGKNHILLMEAFASWKKKTKAPHQLLFVGADWSGADVVKSFAKGLPVRDEIHFLGYVSQEAIVNLYNLCALAIYPSLYEGFGFPVLEAMGCGAPVICSEGSSLYEIAEGRAVFFDPLSSSSLEQAISLGLMQKRGENVAYAHSFDWKKTATEVVEVYESVARR